MGIKSVVASMLQENTGVSMMDSGGDDGRWYQRRAGVDLTTTPKAWLDEDGYTKSLFWHLVDNVEGVYEEYDDDYTAYHNELLKERPFTSNYDSFMGWLKKKSIALVRVENTYNAGTTIDSGMQVYNLRKWCNGGYDYFTAVSTHNGADARGGYSRPRIFVAPFEDILHGIGYGQVFCPSCKWQAYTEDGYLWHEYEGNDWIANHRIDEWLSPTDNKHHCPNCNGELKAE